MLQKPWLFNMPSLILCDSLSGFCRFSGLWQQQKEIETGPRLRDFTVHCSRHPSLWTAFNVWRQLGTVWRYSCLLNGISCSEFELERQFLKQNDKRAKPKWLFSSLGALCSDRSIPVEHLTSCITFLPHPQVWSLKIYSSSDHPTFLLARKSNFNSLRYI